MNIKINMLQKNKNIQLIFAIVGLYKNTQKVEDSIQYKMFPTETNTIHSTYYYFYGC